MGLLDEFLANDVSVADATVHLWGDLDREALLLARVRPSSASLRAARDAIGSMPSAIAREAFLARPLARKGQHDEALTVRLEALRFTPRWDPFQSGLVLSGVSESLSALGRTADAVVVAREASRHAPLDPYALRAFASAAGRTDGAAVAAWLRDEGYGKPIVDDAPTDEERAADAAPLSLRDVAPISDEEMTRFLVLTEVDEAFDSKRYKFVRHATALIRRSELGLARNVAEGDDGDSGLANALAGFFNLAPPDEIAWLQKDSIRRTLEATPEGASAKSATRAKKPNRNWSYAHLAHIGYRTQLAKEGDAYACEALLFSPSRPALVEGLARLGAHPIVERFRVLRDELLRQFPAPLENQTNRGSRDIIGSDGRSVSFPVRDDFDKSELPPRIALVENATYRCSACKARLEKGACVLLVGRMSRTDGEAKWKRFHLACAATEPSQAKALQRARERARRPEPEAP